MTKNLNRLFQPKSIAVLGASQDYKTISGQPIIHLKNHGYQGAVYPVNPKYEEVAGYTCYPSVASLPEIPDLALILINAKRVPAVLRECGEKGIPFAIIFSSGFSETGLEGTQLQQEVIAIAKEYGIGVVGPNCQGMMNITNRVFAGFGSVFYIDSFRSGPVSMVTQSGGFGYSVLSLAEQQGLGFHQVVTTGNEVGISTMDFMEYFIDDPSTEIISGYIEGLKDAHRLLEIGESALQKKKPILIWKVGNTEVGKKAAASHTANLGGESAFYQAAFKQKGIIEVQDIQDLADYGKAFLSKKQPWGNRVAIVTISGGAGILFADECVGMGMEVPSLSIEGQKKLKEVVPSFGSILNPIDVTANIFNQPDLLRKALQIIVEDSEIDSVAIINASVPGKLAEQIAAEIVDVNRQTDKPLFVAWSAREDVAKEAYNLLDDASIPHYRTPVRCARSLGVLSQFAESCRRGEQQRMERTLVVERPNLRNQLAKEKTDISEYRAKMILQEYGIPITQEELTQTADEAVKAALRIGFPVAMKIQSPDIPHKTEAKAVCLGVSNPEEVRNAFDLIMENAKEYLPSAHLEGVLVQEMVQGGVEVILGATNDPLFGPTLMFGLGGIFVEVLKDVSFCFPPITPSYAKEWIRSIKGYPILTGTRGKPPMDIEALEDTILKLSNMVVDLKSVIAELDINPLFVFEKGKGVKAGDALIKPLTRNRITMNMEQLIEKRGYLYEK